MLSGPRVRGLETGAHIRGADVRVNYLGGAEGGANRPPPWRPGQPASFSLALTGRPPTGQQATPTVSRVKLSTCSRVASASLTQLR